MAHPNEAPGGPADPDARLERELAALRAEYETLKDEKVRTEQNLANIRQQLGELEHRFVRERKAVRERELLGLALERLDEPWVAVPDAHHHRATTRVDPLLPVGRPDAAALGAHGRR